MTDTQFSEYFPLGIEPGMIVPYAHKGKWAVHELLPFFFDELGSFHLSLATFNISEESLRPIFFMKDRGELLSARFLFDTNIRRHKIDMLLFARSVADDIRLSSSHMKVMLCCNDFTSIAVVGSANMNRNIRHEAGFITTDDRLYRYYADYFDEVFNHDSIPFLI